MYDLMFLTRFIHLSSPDTPDTRKKRGVHTASVER